MYREKKFRGRYHHLRAPHSCSGCVYFNCGGYYLCNKHFISPWWREKRNCKDYKLYFPKVIQLSLFDEL